MARESLTVADAQPGETTKRRLVVVSCSSRKSADSGPVPALDRYDGPVFRIFRKLKRTGLWPADVDVLVLSAKYGLIPDSLPITSYDQRMTAARARDLRATVLAQWREYFHPSQHREIFVNLGSDYLLAMQAIDMWRAHTVFASGRVGQRLRQTRDWLLGLKK